MATDYLKEGPADIILHLLNGGAQSCMEEIQASRYAQSHISKERPHGKEI